MSILPTWLHILFLIYILKCNAFNTWEKEVYPNHEIWRSAPGSQFIPVQAQSFGDIRIGEVMSAEFDFIWHNRTSDPTRGFYENFFRVGAPAYSKDCYGEGSRYPSFWLTHDRDSMHVSVSDGDTNCQAEQSLNDYGDITKGVSYHVRIAFNQTQITVDVTNNDQPVNGGWPNIDWTQSWLNIEPTQSVLLGQTVPIWWMSDKYSGSYNRGNGTFWNIVIKSSIFPSDSPTSNPTTQPTQPTINPTTTTPTIPTSNPSSAPSTSPPTNQPSATPSQHPTAAPSIHPTIDTPNPSTAPTPIIPTTARPSVSPTTAAPTTFAPTLNPTMPPTNNPSVSPITAAPTTAAPTSNPTSIPTNNPTTNNPTLNPSTTPTIYPTQIPSVSPTSSAPTTSGPTTNPITAQPTIHPSTTPTLNPTTNPTQHPTTHPTTQPSTHPTTQPITSHPTTYPSTNPTAYPSTQPTESPTDHPSLQPTHIPTQPPSYTPTKSPTSYTPSPTLHPSLTPTYIPSHNPTIEPTANPIPITSTNDDDNTGANVSDKDSAFWNEDPYTYIFYGAIVFVAFLLIAMAVCCYCKFKPEIDDDDDDEDGVEYHFDITGQSMGKKRTMTVPIDSKYDGYNNGHNNNKNNNRMMPVQTHTESHHALNDSRTIPSQEPIMNGPQGTKWNNNTRIGRTGSNVTTGSATSDEDVLKGAYGGHITANDANETTDVFPRDKLRTINDDHALSPNHRNNNIIMPIDMDYGDSSDRHLDLTDEEDGNDVYEDEYDDETYGYNDYEDDDDEVCGHMTVGAPPDYPQNRHYVDGDEMYIVEMITKDELRRKVENDLHEEEIKGMGSRDKRYSQNIYHAQQQNDAMMNDIINEMEYVNSEHYQ